MPTLAIKSGTTSIAGAIVKGNFSYFSANTTTDLGPTSSTGLYSGIDAPSGGYTVYRIGGSNGWTARVATDTASLNSILISYGATGTTVNQNVTWATNTDSVFINSGATATYTIGEAALGGIISYINGGGSSGTSGLVATVSDISTGAGWGCGFPAGITIGGTSAAIGTGAANTALILAGCSEAGIAARLCADLTEGGYSDWYLPSQGELTAMYTNKDTIGGFENGYYWTSTEVDVDFAKAVTFYDGSAGNFFKGNTLRVRPIRSF
jgi:hypothetical protein